MKIIRKGDVKVEVDGAPLQGNYHEDIGNSEKPFQKNHLLECSDNKFTSTARLKA